MCGAELLLVDTHLLTANGQLTVTYGKEITLFLLLVVATWSYILLGGNDPS